jgi:hypothetical protein
MEPKPTIFLALAQFSHYSDVLRSRFLSELTKSTNVIVLTPAIDTEVAKRDRYPTHPNVRYVKMSIADPRGMAFFEKFLRVPFIRSFDHLTYHRFFYQRRHAWQRKLLMRLRVLFPRSLFTPDRITRWELRRFKPTPNFVALVREGKPVLLVTATPGFTPFEAEMILYAEVLGIPTVAVNLNYDNLTSNAKMIRKTDYLLVWNEGMAREARELHGYTESQYDIVGCLRFDHYFTDPVDPAFPSREAFLRQKGFDPAKKTIVLAGPTPSNYPPRRELVETLIRLKREDQFEGDPNILIRIHPIDSLETYAGLVDSPGVHIERAGRQTLPDSAGGQKIEMDEGDTMNLTATLKYADVVLNFASTVIMEAAIFERPVINIAFPAYRNIVYRFEYNKGLLDTGAVRLANTPDELADLVNRYLHDSEQEQSEREKLVRRYIPFRDGRTWERTVRFIERVVSEQAKP